MTLTAAKSDFKAEVIDESRDNNHSLFRWQRVKKDYRGWGPDRPDSRAQLNQNMLPQTH
jgi:hypothetical protein